MTAVPENGSVAYFDDIYGRDIAQLNIGPQQGGVLASR
jgi:murein L,D-transpeptidase YcbB/YkuD